jgi:leader peptidase (prepilin peptidase)/N-methyltransferase
MHPVTALVAALATTLLLGALSAAGLLRRAATTLATPPPEPAEQPEPAAPAGPVRVRAPDPLIVALAAAAAGLAGLGIGAAAALAAYLWLALAAVALVLVDLDQHRLPNRIVYPTYLAGLALLGAAALVDGAGHRYVRALVAMAALYTVFLLLALAAPSALGLGDVKLAGLLGLYLGYLGGGVLLVGMATGVVLGALAAICLLLARRVGWRGDLAYGPALLAGALVAVGVGQPFWDAYTSAAGIG